MFYQTINPVLLHIGPVEIRYYGIIYALGFIIAYLMLRYFSRTKRLSLSYEDIDEYLVYLIVAVVIGARLFEIIFYDPAYYIAQPLKMFAVWEGGLSFHGGLAGAIAATWWFSRKKQIRWYVLADMLAMPAAIGLGLGRIANFINGELIGKVTNLPWGVKFQGYEGFRHPSQLYESAKNFIIFAVLWPLKDKVWHGKKLPDGFLSCLFVMLYSVLRFLVEFVKEPEGPVFFGWMNMGQALSVAAFVLAVFALSRLRWEHPPHEK